MPIHKGLPANERSDFRSWGIDKVVNIFARDEGMIQSLVAILMHTEGAFVLSASDCQLALDFARRHPGSIDFAVTDLRAHGLESEAVSNTLVETWDSERRRRTMRARARFLTRTPSAKRTNHSLNVKRGERVFGNGKYVSVVSRETCAADVLERK